MALEKSIATGLEPPCYRCGEKFKPGDMKIKMPSDRPSGFPDTFTVGGKTWTWVHDKSGCNPAKAKGVHHSKMHKRNKKGH